MSIAMEDTIQKFLKHSGIRRCFCLEEQTNTGPVHMEVLAMLQNHCDHQPQLMVFHYWSMDVTCPNQVLSSQWDLLWSKTVARIRLSGFLKGDLSSNTFFSPQFPFLPNLLLPWWWTKMASLGVYLWIQAKYFARSLGDSPCSVPLPSTKLLLEKFKGASRLQNVWMLHSSEEFLEGKALVQACVHVWVGFKCSGKGHTVTAL